MWTKRRIGRELYETCYRVETEIVGNPAPKARLWAKANAKRHACTAEAILKHARENALKSLTVLNASGVSCGHQDFSLIGFLRRELSIDWVAFESPRSPYLEYPAFNKMLNEYPVQLELADFTRGSSLFGTGRYDIVLFTEIAEHLDHTTFLTALTALRERLNENGIVILTTPNFTYITNRVKILLGNGDIHYFGDGTENLNRGLWGHIAFFDFKRLKRILSDVGLGVSHYYTFNYHRVDRTVFTVLSDFVSCGVRDSRQTLFVVARNSAPVKIPCVT